MSQGGKDSGVVVNTSLVIAATFLELEMSNGFRKYDLQPSAGLRRNKGLNVLEMERFVARKCQNALFSERWSNLCVHLSEK